MPLYQTVLCAIDFSDHSKYALRIGLEMARHCRARVVVFHAIDPLLAEAAAAAYDEQRLRADAEAELRAFVRTELTNGAADLPDLVVQVGPADRALLECVSELGVDLIMMGTQGLGGFRKAFFGSVTEKVLRGAAVPVLAVKLPGGDPAAVPRSVVIAIDVNDSATAVLQHGLAFAAEFTAPATLLHVVAAIQALPQYTDALAAAQADRAERARTWLAQKAATLPRNTSVRIEVRTGSVADEVAAFMKASPGAFLAIGTGDSRILHRPGSTAYRVLSLAPSPVLVIPTRH